MEPGLPGDYRGDKIPTNILCVIVCLLAALVAANSLGVIVALISKSFGEVHLFAILAVLLVSGLSGLFGGQIYGL